jgi:lysophospholipase L1-like esterase
MLNGVLSAGFVFAMPAMISPPVSLLSSSLARLAAVATLLVSPLFAQPAPALSLRFDFGPGAAAEGHTRVVAEDVYSPEKGFGFDFGSKPVGVDRGGADAVRGDFITSEEPFFFSVAVAEGNYRVVVTLGDADGESRTTIRSETGRLMVPLATTGHGKFDTRTFIANVRRPMIMPAPPANAPGRSEVHMFLKGEAEARCWDDRLTIEFNGARPCVNAIEIVKDDAVPTLFVAGDSTVGDPRRGPGGNWPTQICQFFKPDIAVCNSAEGGETSKSFITGNRFDKVLSQMKAGDFFLVQFGHNDSKQQWPQSYTEPATSFKAYLRVFLAETRRRGATLVLVTPMERRMNGDTVGPWARAMREVAAEDNVPLIDQWAMSKQLWTSLGANVNRAFTDQTHLSGYGGYLLSRCVATGIKQSVPQLAKHLVDDFEAIDLANPPTAPAYLSQSPGPGVPPRAPRSANEPAASRAPAPTL